MSPPGWGAGGRWDAGGWHVNTQDITGQNSFTHGDDSETPHPFPIFILIWIRKQCLRHKMVVTQSIMGYLLGHVAGRWDGWVVVTIDGSLKRNSCQKGTITLSEIDIFQCCNGGIEPGQESLTYKWWQHALWNKCGCMFISKPMYTWINTAHMYRSR